MVTGINSVTLCICSSLYNTVHYITFKKVFFLSCCTKDSIFLLSYVDRSFQQGGGVCVASDTDGKLLAGAHEKPSAVCGFFLIPVEHFLILHAPQEGQKAGKWYSRVIIVVYTSHRYTVCMYIIYFIGKGNCTGKISQSFYCIEKYRKTYQCSISKMFLYKDF